MTVDLRGIIVPMVTPMRPDESLDIEALARVTEHLIASGVHGLFPAGSQGEFFSLTAHERELLFDVVVEQTAGRVPVVCGTGAVTTRETVALSRAAQAAGADAVAVITPYFIRPSDDELRAHFMAVCEAVDLPVLAYNNPARTGVPLSAELIASLAVEAPNFCGIKDSSGDLTLTLSYQQRCPEGFQVFVGRDTLIYAALCHGCAGSVAASANVVPKLVAGIYEAYLAGEREQALDRQRALNPLRHAFRLGSFPVVVKEAMALAGMPVGPCRAPIEPLSAQARAGLERVVQDLAPWL